MDLTRTAAISRQERKRRRITEDPGHRKIATTNYKDVVHMARLAQPTIRHHNLIRRYWAEFLQDEVSEGNMAQDVAEPSMDIKPGSPLPPFNLMKCFLRWMVLSLSGRVNDYIRTTTLEHNLRTFLALWPRYAQTKVPKPTKDALLDFVYSKNLSESVPLTTAERPKRICDEVDVDILFRATWHDRVKFRTARMRMQMHSVLSLASLSSERIGALIESHCHLGTNEALLWRNCAFFLFPNADDLAHPHLTILITIELLKGLRHNASRDKSFLLEAEPTENRASCPAFSLLCLALQDSIFQNVNTIKEIVSPKVHSSEAYTLPIKKEWQDRPIFRGEEYVNGGCVVSPSRALTYHSFRTWLTAISNAAGFPHPVQTYDIRRGTSARFSHLISEDERRILMSHGPQSDMYSKHYKSSISTVDLQGLRASNKEDVATTARLRALVRSSVLLDPNAPLTLNAADRAALMGQPDLLQHQEEIAALQEKHALLKSQPQHGSDTLSPAAQAAAVREISSQIAVLRRRYHQDLERLTRKKIAENRAKHFADHAYPRDPISPPTLPTSPATSDPLDGLCHLLYHAQTSTPDNLIDAVHAYLNLPNRPFQACYPGESPTKENKCPVCSKLCIPAFMNSAGSVARHIHACVAKQHQAEVEALSTESYRPQHCQWAHCRLSGAVWPSRKAFVQHIQNTHLRTLDRAQTNDATACQWRLDDGVPCEETNCEDWTRHFSQAHGLNVQPVLMSHYCYLCHEWTDDYDPFQWEDHCEHHHQELFRPFSSRAQDIDVQPVGIAFLPFPHNAIEYDHGQGFDGLRPQFHGEILPALAMSPIFCPYCVFDEKSPFSKRMKQWDDNASFKSHLEQHLTSLPALLQCPVPSCGTRAHGSLRDLKYHLITVHRLPACGGKVYPNVQRLFLPQALGQSATSPT